MPEPPNSHTAIPAAPGHQEQTLGEESDGERMLTGFMGLRHIEPGVARLTLRPALLTASGMLLGPVGFALVDYTMGSKAWSERHDPAETVATISITLNYLRSAQAGEIECVSSLDRRGRTTIALRSEVRHEDGRLLIVALGTFSVFTPMPSS